MSSHRAASADRASAAGGSALKLSAFLPYRLSVMSAVVSEGLARSYSERFGISTPEWRVLATVGEFRSITAKALGHHAHMNKVKVSRAATSLERRGLIRRLPNPEDLREAFLVLTPEGDRVYGEVAPLALAYVETLTAGLSAPDRAHLDRLIDALLHRAGEMGA